VTASGSKREMGQARSRKFFHATREKNCEL